MILGGWPDVAHFVLRSLDSLHCLSLSCPYSELGPGGDDIVEWMSNCPACQALTKRVRVVSGSLCQGGGRGWALVTCATQPSFFFSTSHLTRRLSGVPCPHPLRTLLRCSQLPHPSFLLPSPSSLAPSGLPPGRCHVNIL